MLAIFRNNNFLSVFLIPLIAAALWFNAFEQPPILPVKHTMPLYETLWYILGNSFTVKIWVAFFLIIFEAFYLNLIFDKHNFLNRKSFLPAIIYVLLVSSFKEAQQLNPIICAMLFLMFAFSKIVKTYRQDSASSEIFDASILISIATLFYFPVIIIYPIIWVALIVIRPFIWREWIISLSGFILPYLFVFMAYYWFNRVSFFVFDKIVFPASFHLQDIFSESVYTKITLSIFALFALLGIINSIAKVSTNTIFARNMAVIMVWTLLLSIATFFLSPQASIVYFLCSFIPITYYFSNMFINIKKMWLGEILFISFILLAIINVYFG